jgi:adenine-specific DNA-methyltransferase
VNFMANETAQKLRGGYYTSEDLATFLANWVGVTRPRRVLEPSCGDGAFLAAVAAADGLADARVTSFELDHREATKAKVRAASLGIEAEVRAQDFLGWALEALGAETEPFDAVLGNPPFIRYQYLPETFQDRAESVFRKLGCKFTKHTNAWVPFILASLALLRPGGRLAMVVPSEIIHVMHAQSLRDYLSATCRRFVIVDPEEIWFSDTLQGAVLLMAEKAQSGASGSGELGVCSVRNREFLDTDPEVLFSRASTVDGRDLAGKWTKAFLDSSTRDLFVELSAHHGVSSFKQVADVDVGIVTGANKFFLVEDEVVSRYGLETWAHPMFGRSEHCPGVIYDVKQHRENARKGNPTNFLWFGEQEAKKSAAVRRYISHGEALDLHKRYKTRIRSTWYAVPSVYSTEVGMLKRAHDAPRLILNKAGAYTTDTAYRIRPHAIAAEQLVASFMNPLTALSAELEGRHYGGGVLELVPSEIEKLLIPVHESPPVDLLELDRDVRNQSAESVLSSHGIKSLKALGVSQANADQMMAGWTHLRRRRQRIPADE